MLPIDTAAVSRLTRTLPHHMHAACFLEELAHVRRPGTNGAILPRLITLSEQQALAACVRRVGTFQQWAVIPVADSARHLRCFIKQACGLPTTTPAAKLLLEDLNRLVRTYALLLDGGAKAVMLRLENHETRRQFHLDGGFGPRLLCTYCGPGTLWVPDEAADRRALQQGAARLPERLYLTASAVQHVKPGWLLAMQGGDRGLAHSAPDYAPGDGATRLFALVEPVGTVPLYLARSRDVRQNLWQSEVPLSTLL